MLLVNSTSVFTELDFYKDKVVFRKVAFTFANDNDNAQCPLTRLHELEANPTSPFTDESSIGVLISTLNYKLRKLKESRNYGESQGNND